MADFAVTTIELDANSDQTIDTGVGTAIDPTKTAVITPTGPLEEGFIIVQNTFNGAKVVTVAAGDERPAMAAGQGALAVSVADGDASYAAEIIGPLSSARFMQDNGTVRVTFAADMTGFIAWYQMSSKA